MHQRRSAWTQHNACRPTLNCPASSLSTTASRKEPVRLNAYPHDAPSEASGLDRGLLSARLKSEPVEMRQPHTPPGHQTVSAARPSEARSPALTDRGAACSHKQHRSTRNPYDQHEADRESSAELFDGRACRTKRRTSHCRSECKIHSFRHGARQCRRRTQMARFQARREAHLGRSRYEAIMLFRSTTDAPDVSRSTLPTIATASPTRQGGLPLMILHQHEAAEFGTEMTIDPFWQRCQDGASIRRDPAFAPVTDRAYRNRQVLNQEWLMALENRSFRDRGFHHTVFDGNPRRNPCNPAACSSFTASTARCPGPCRWV